MVDVFNLTVGEPAAVTFSSQGGWAGLESLYPLLTSQPGEKILLPTGASWFVADLGSVKSVRQLALLYTDLRAGDTVRFRGSSSPDGLTSPSLDSGLLQVEVQGQKRPDLYRHVFYHLEVAAPVRYVRVDVVVSTQRKAGVLYFSNPLQLEHNPDFGSTSWGYEEAPEGDILDSGVEVLQALTPAPVLNFTATWVSQSEMEAGWEELGRLQWDGRPVLVARRPDPHPGRHNGLYWGRLRMTPVVASEFDMFELQGRIRAMI